MKSLRGLEEKRRQTRVCAWTGRLLPKRSNVLIDKNFVRAGDDAEACNMILEGPINESDRRGGRKILLLTLAFLNIFLFLLDNE